MSADAVDMRFRTINHVGLIAACEAGLAARGVRDIYRAAVIRGNPKQALVIIRQTLRKSAEAVDQLRQFDTELLALLAEVEASIPAEEPEPETT